MATTEVPVPGASSWRRGQTDVAVTPASVTAAGLRAPDQIDPRTRAEVPKDGRGALERLRPDETTTPTVTTADLNGARQDGRPILDIGLDDAMLGTGRSIWSLVLRTAVGPPMILAGAITVFPIPPLGAGLLAGGIAAEVAGHKLNHTRRTQSRPSTPRTA